MKFRISTFAKLVWLLPVCTSVVAQPEEWRGSVGVGPGLIPEYSGSDSTRVIPYVSARIQAGNRYFAVRGLNARANLLERTGLEFGPTAKVTVGRESEIDSAAVAALGKIDNAMELGVFLAYVWSPVESRRSTYRLAAQIVNDVTNVHDGWHSTVGLGYSTQAAKRLRVGWQINVNVASDDYSATYYTVTPEGAMASGLPAFSAEGGVNDIGANLSASFAITRQWWLSGSIGFRRLLGDAAASPIVADEGSTNQFSAAAAVAYRF